MKKFELPSDLSFNKGLIQDPTTYIKEGRLQILALFSRSRIF